MIGDGNCLKRWSCPSLDLRSEETSVKWACGGVTREFLAVLMLWNWLQCANLLLLLGVIQAESASPQGSYHWGKSFSILEQCKYSVCDINSPKIQFLINTSAFAASSFPSAPSPQSHKWLFLSQIPTHTTHTFHPPNILTLPTVWECIWDPWSLF